MRSARGDVRDTLKNGLQQVSLSGPKSANKRLMHRSKWRPLDGCKRVGSRL